MRRGASSPIWPVVALALVACGGARSSPRETNDVVVEAPSSGVAAGVAAEPRPTWWCFESVFGIQCPGTEKACTFEAEDAGLRCFEVRDVWCFRFDDEDGATPEHCSGDPESCRGYERFIAGFAGGLPIVQHCAAGSRDGP